MASTGAITNKFHSAKSTSPFYWIKVTIPDLGLEVIADMPEELQSAVGSEWEGLLPASLADAGAIGASANKISQILTGSGYVYQDNTKQTWVNSSPLEFSISLQFDADEDAFREVYAPIRILEMAALPSKNSGGFLFAPGANGLFGTGSVTRLEVGTLFTLDSCILIAAQGSMSARLDEKGYPISGRCDLTIRTDRVLSREDWARMNNMSNLSIF